MPKKVVLRANEILHFLEKDKHKNQSNNKFENVPKVTSQISLFESDPRFVAVDELIKKLDINTISPVEALLKLNEIISLMKK
jgi:DNA mismatch repair protein MutS